MRVIKALFVAGAMALTAPALSFADTASVIVMDYERILTQSVAGRDLETRLRGIQTQMQGELQTETNAISTEQQSIQTAVRGRTQAQVQADTALSNRIQAFERRANTLRQRQVSLSRDFEYTRAQALVEFNRQLQPYVRQVMQAQRAGVVLDRSDTQLVADGVDYTTDILTRFDQNVRTITVTRQTAPAQASGGGAAPAAGR